MGSSSSWLKIFYEIPLSNRSRNFQSHMFSKKIINIYSYTSSCLCIASSTARCNNACNQLLKLLKYPYMKNSFACLILKIKHFLHGIFNWEIIVRFKRKKMISKWFGMKPFDECITNDLTFLSKSLTIPHEKKLLNGFEIQKYF
jgi:hypothetical protein